MKICIVWSDDAWEDPFLEAVYATKELGIQHIKHMLKDVDYGIDKQYEWAEFYLYDKKKHNRKRLWVEEYEVMTVVNEVR